MLTARIAARVASDAGSWMSVVKMNVSSVTDDHQQGEDEHPRPRAGLPVHPEVGDGHEREDHQRDRAADGCDRRQVEPDHHRR